MIDPIYHKWIVLFVTLFVLVGLYLEKFKPAVVFLAGVFVLLLLKVIDSQVFLDSFSNKSIIIIFMLVFITNTVNDNFNMSYWLDKLFSGSSSPKLFLFKMMTSISVLSSFMNNTPIVALMTPYVTNWGKKNKVSPSKLLIPLSYVASLGGMITVIGTSTNLVMQSFLEESGEPLLTFSNFFIPGVLVTIVGILYFLTIGYKILPDRKAPSSDAENNQRQYLVETYVTPNSRLIGKSLVENGLRKMNGVYLAQIIRQDEMIAPVGPDEIIQNDDRLFFAGETEKVVDFVRVETGIQLSTHGKYKLGKKLDVVEAVIPSNSYLAGKTVRESNFRDTFDAAIIGIHRNGEKIFGKIGDVRLKNGDLLLLTVGKRFFKNPQKDKNIYVVSHVDTVSSENPLQKSSFWVFIVSVLSLLSFGFFDLFMSVMIIMMMLITLKLTTYKHVRKEGGNLILFVVLASALTLGKALISSGAAEMISNLLLVAFKPYGTVFLMLGIFIMTLLLTSFITNVAAISIAFPIVYSLVHEMNVVGTPYYVMVCFAASASFLTPVAYQTNLMVYGPGSYKFRDFTFVGAPLTVLYFAAVLSYVVIWNF